MSNDFMRTNSVFKKRILNFAFQMIAWTIIAVIPFLLGPSKPAGRQGLPVPLLASWMLLAIFYFLNYYVFIPGILFRERVSIYTFIVALSAVLFISISELSIRFLKDRIHAVPSDFFVIGRLASLVSFLLIFLVSLSTAVIRELFDAWGKKQKAETARKEAELASLKLQVNPHFLFNTLYSIHYLVVSKSDIAPDAILKLSGLMRFLLSESQEKFIPLPKEVEYIQKYIDLQKLRISERTSVAFEIVGDYSTRQIAPLLLFPFVENAFKYGVSSHEETTIYIGLLVTENIIQFVVNNKKFQTIDEHKKNNIGLQNVSNRLNLIYPRLHQLKIINGENTFSIDLRIYDEPLF